MSSSPARPAGSAPPSFPSFSPRAIRSPGWRARRPRRLPLTAAGAQVHRGTIDDLDGLRDAAAASDGVIHLAFKHDIAFTGDFQGAADADRRAVETFGEVLAGSGRPLVIASGMARAHARAGGDRTGRAEPGLRHGASGRRPAGPAGHRAAHALPRLPRRPLVGSAAPARRCTVTETTASWQPWSASPATRACRATSATERTAGPPCTGLDAAHLFRLAVEQAPAGSVLHAIADEGVPIRAIAEVIGQPSGPAGDCHFSRGRGRALRLAGRFLAMDVPASSELTRELMDWQPVQPGLIDDLGKGHYFHG